MISLETKIELGTKVEDWHNDRKVGTYIVSIIPSFDRTNESRYALVNINGRGLGNGYFNTLGELEEVVLNDSSFKVID
jgi:hypothetical protein